MAARLISEKNLPKYEIVGPETKPNITINEKIWLDSFTIIK